MTFTFRFVDANCATSGASPWHENQNGWKNIATAGWPFSCSGAMLPRTMRAAFAGVATSASSAEIGRAHV